MAGEDAELHPNTPRPADSRDGPSPAGRADLCATPGPATPETDPATSVGQQWARPGRVEVFGCHPVQRRGRGWGYCS